MASRSRVIAAGAALLRRQLVTAQTPAAVQDPVRHLCAPAAVKFPGHTLETAVASRNWTQQWRFSTKAEANSEPSAQPKPEASTEAEEPSSPQEEPAAQEAGDLDEKDKEVAVLKERVLRAYADMENLRDRMLRENEQIKVFAIQGFAKGLLDVADNLSRASAVAAAALPSKEGSDMSAEAALKHLRSLLEGVQATERQLMQVFKKHGLERFSPLGEPFNPNEHEAMFEVPDQAKEHGTVLQVLKDGYSLHGRVLRAAEVGVSRKDG